MKAFNEDKTTQYCIRNFLKTNQRWVGGNGCTWTKHVDREKRNQHPNKCKVFKEQDRKTISRNIRPRHSLAHRKSYNQPYKIPKYLTTTTIQYIGNRNETLRSEQINITVIANIKLLFIRVQNPLFTIIRPWDKDPYVLDKTLDNLQHSFPSNHLIIVEHMNLLGIYWKQHTVNESSPTHESKLQVTKKLKYEECWS